MKTLKQLRTERDKLKARIREMQAQERHLQAQADEFENEADEAEQARSGLDEGCHRLDALLSDFEFEMRDEAMEYGFQVDEINKKIDKLIALLHNLRGRIRRAA